MTLTRNSPFMATVIATVVGTGAWWFGLFNMIWRAHPFLADLRFRWSRSSSSRKSGDASSRANFSH
jgi:hypothetical protein